jgi:hypothetical protein
MLREHVGDSALDFCGPYDARDFRGDLGGAAAAG